MASWELFNEADLSELRVADLPAWVKEMSQYLREIDPNDHLITISFHHESAEAIWSQPTIDLVQVHLYEQRDFSETFCGSMIPKLRQAFHKPVMVGEFGWITDFVRQLDRGGIHVHDGLWSSLMGGAVSSALIWYWDLYVHPNRLERHFRPLAMFWRGEQLKSPLRQVEVSFSDADLGGCGVATPQRTYVWLKNRRHNVDQYLAYRGALAKQRLRQGRGSSSATVVYPPRTIRGARMTIRGAGVGGRYRLEWWDPYQGRVMASAVTQAQAGSLTVEVPELKYDVAVKLIKLPWWERSEARQ